MSLVCGTLRSAAESFRLEKTDANTLIAARSVLYRNRACDFHSLAKARAIPLHAVDEPIYRRLPAFMIATVDKFAGMPWTGEIAGFFGKAERFDQDGFYSPAEPGRGQPLPQPLRPPDLVIQDELHI